MGLKSFLILGLFLQLLSADKLHTRQSVDCDFSVAASNGDTCQSFTRMWLVNFDKFLLLNPGIDCSSLSGGQLYCLKGNVTSVSTTSMATASTTTTMPSPTTPLCDDIIHNNFYSNYHVHYSYT
ncbi:uncharacterized protein ATNIH1004_004725 [Aspergillus tanneri]|uniref:LysM domain-containing protein n=1 Tax=Aspergillus tanneri TaxID=1220188 RepID=A0A5M9MW71_9EURO|nr:uncharacterized protein ATNIH1004_004725 [Aspergillus tanneri]KAA8648839.1 hypothetical protein ATNIH1004_004725 [Aspergillus tanneri]